jgi:hypothetical protein
VRERIDALCAEIVASRPRDTEQFHSAEMRMQAIVATAH